ncbi:hypothetical protein OK016_08485 [Vibrio chagasii]|nr:hypothetical protein [Vibrio chagasii]
MRYQCFADFTKTPVTRKVGSKVPCWAWCVLPAAKANPTDCQIAIPSGCLILWPAVIRATTFSSSSINLKKTEPTAEFEVI